MSDSSEDTGGVTGIILARIEVKLDNALTVMTDHEQRIRTLEAHQTGDHDARITSLERWRNAIPATIVAALASCVSAVLTAILK